MVSTPEIALGDGSTGSLGASEATGVTTAAVELADGATTSALPPEPDSDPALFAAPAAELVVCADTAESART
ncbi:hypothetical protein BST42_19330 [Mycolicibacterium rhodesiae]|uniref:Uncharacterized protein n=1 Tax=Mycolicibacterium rhodesiae TaxID=36814 RepID=A0A1X0IR44_MYCRH|nr:hypothetical protein BST42_19330 [Mycolicibacterium rhodesiae]